MATPRYEQVREIATKHGYVANIALPLLDGPQIIGALSIHSREPDSFDEAEVQLLEELAGDLTSWNCDVAHT